MRVLKIFFSCFLLIMKKGINSSDFYYQQGGRGSKQSQLSVKQTKKVIAFYQVSVVIARHFVGLVWHLCTVCTLHYTDLVGCLSQMKQVPDPPPPPLQHGGGVKGQTVTVQVCAMVCVVCVVCVCWKGERRVQNWCFEPSPKMFDDWF